MENKLNKGLNISLWIVQIVLAAGFIWAAYMKLLKPAATLAQMWPWAGQYRVMVKFTGVIDLLAALGLVLPAALRIIPKTTIYTALATIVLMILASVFHIVRGEASSIGINIAFALMAAFIAWGRMGKAKVEAK